MIDWENLVWSCHFCKESRPDAQVGVAARTRTLPGTEVVVRETRRYCKDRAVCRQAAGAWAVAPANAVR